MAAQIKEKFGIEVELISSGGGVFEIRKDNKLVFSKRATGRFPDPEEVFELLS